MTLYQFFSHPDYTVGSGIAPDQLALTDLTISLGYQTKQS
ncbi:hypothetical protein Sinf_0571 [Streptococcus infantarius subsp. infantarius CJ18]|uniref:Uncharacterized protein n=1 Tax=Streptococcus infantarius subsp. infantarius ATCC BAA-102 TaxID=471872 RepID=A0ABP2DFS8_9STRE|nr:hypothetical protein Sinf_0571 [Streptococcus infantarius subsp. infantarius CJ18]EDT47126.1 hypothetical protein STRINF_01427 [Streptococcus infantarius subsp. infantarius ATCC BAA-102]